MVSEQQPAHGHNWEPQAAATEWVQQRVESFLVANPTLAKFSRLLLSETGTRLSDWIDHLSLQQVDGIEAIGYEPDGHGWYRHPQALLPSVHYNERDRLMLRVDSVIDFVTANAHRFVCSVDGEPVDAWRAAVVVTDDAAEFGAIERHGCRTLAEATRRSPRDKHRAWQVRERLLSRPRQFEDSDSAFEQTQTLVADVIGDVGINATCDLFFEAERVYWQSRNRAGQIQYMRQQALGLGWGNHDHHTYRSSRIAFHRLIAILEMLGCECRERFYAGAEAGWGAQVLEQPVCGVVIFADVDLGADEITGDFAHEPLPPRDDVGTIGLWCHLHGEALFEAGMHHLECQYDFEAARQQLEAFGICSMPPFTDFPWLKQCFTEGAVWNVRPRRIQEAVENRWITPEQAARFENSGVVGSHLEILERNDGYRGFNQTGINDIILKTDPRVAPAEMGQASIG